MLEDFAFNIVIYFFLVTTGIRVAVTAIHVYAGFACSFRDKTVSLCNGTDALGQPIYNTVETLSFYLEGTTLLVFLIVLLLWRSYNYRRLFPCHLCCIPVTYTYGILVAVCMILEPFCTTDTKVVHTAWKLFIVGYEYELLMYYLAVVALYSLRPAVLRRTIKDYAQHSLKRWLCYVAWCSFLIMSAGHSILLAGYDAMKATSTLHKTHIPRTDYDSLSLIVSITTRSLLAKSFFDKLFEWPCQHKNSRRRDRVCVYEPRRARAIKHPGTSRRNGPPASDLEHSGGGRTPHSLTASVTSLVQSNTYYTPAETVRLPGSTTESSLLLSADSYQSYHSAASRIQ